MAASKKSTAATLLTDAEVKQFAAGLAALRKPLAALDARAILKDLQMLTPRAADLDKAADVALKVYQAERRYLRKPRLGADNADALRERLRADYESMLSGLSFNEQALRHNVERADLHVSQSAGRAYLVGADGEVLMDLGDAGSARALDWSDIATIASIVIEVIGVVAAACDVFISPNHERVLRVLSDRRLFGSRFIAATAEFGRRITLAGTAGPARFFEWAGAIGSYVSIMLEGEAARRALLGAMFAGLSPIQAALAVARLAGAIALALTTSAASLAWKLMMLGVRLAFLAEKVFKLVRNESARRDVAALRQGQTEMTLRAALPA